MPAEKFGYKPTPAQMSVADIAGHLTEGNDYLCSKIGGVEAPKRAEMPKGASKEQLVARLKETFAFCESALAKVNDSDLSAKVPFFGGREVTRAQAMFVTAEDWADHYSQLATYLRLNGLLPPTAKRS
jgi:glutathione S-transferase